MGRDVLVGRQRGERYWWGDIKWREVLVGTHNGERYWWGDIMGKEVLAGTQNVGERATGEAT